MLSGVITSSQGTGGAIEGGLMTVTTGFSLASPDATGVAPANFTTVDVSLAGVGSLSAKAGKGSLKVSGKGSQLPVAVAGPKGVEVFTPSFGLSAQDSKDLNGGALTYQWALIPTVGQSVTLQGAITAKPFVTINDNGFAYGIYTFQLTVTNASGLSSIDTVTVAYDSAQ